MTRLARVRRVVASTPALDRPLLPLRLARARSDGWFVKSGPIDQIVSTELIDLGYLAADAAWNGLGRGTDGTLYCAAGTHSLDDAARLFALTPGSTHVELVADLGAALPSAVGAIAQGKVHVDMPALADGVIGATHVGYYSTPPPGRSYPGGWFFTATADRVRPLVRAPDGEGIIAMAVDRARSVAFALSWPRGLLLELDLQESRLRSHGPVHDAGEAGSREAGTWRWICRSLGIDERTGAVYWSDDAGRITRKGDHRIEPVASLPRSEMWRKVAWHPAEEVFYGAMWTGGDLFRFDPQTAEVDQIGALRLPGASPRVLTSLGFVLDAEANRIHALAAGPGVLRRGEVQLPSSVLYVSHDLSSGETLVHGPLRSQDGRWITRAESLLLAGENAYTVCWAEVTRRHRSARAREVRRLRSRSHLYRFYGYAEEVVLARFGAH
jgi:hypothetical protein